MYSIKIMFFIQINAQCGMERLIAFAPCVLVVAVVETLPVEVSVFSFVQFLEVDPTIK